MEEKKCDCGLLLRRHPTCAGCGGIVGTGHDNQTSSYRGYDLCGWCVQRWRTKEFKVGRELTWKEMLGYKVDWVSPGAEEARKKRNGEIIEKLESGEGIKELCDEYKISKRTVIRIKEVYNGKAAVLNS